MDMVSGTESYADFSSDAFVTSSPKTTGANKIAEELPQEGNVSPQKNDTIDRYLPRTVNRRLFHEERIILNKSCSRWISLGYQGMLNGEFQVVARINENDNIYIQLTRQELKYLFSKIRMDRDLNGYDSRDIGEPWEAEEHWMDNIHPEEYKNRDETIHLQKSSFNKKIYKLGNKKSAEYPHYIQIGRRSLQKLFELNEFIDRTLDMKNEKIIQNSFFDLIEKYKKNRKGSDLAGFLAFETVLAHDKDPLMHSVARDMYTNCFNYTMYVLRSDVTRPE